MAETAAPKLDVAKDAQPYAPVSWAAVAAAASVVVFAIAFLVYAFQAFRSRQPLLIDLFCGMPVLTLVLALVAWMHIRKSEGTRTGMKLTAASFWVALVAGLGYFAYRMAIDMAIDTDAEKQFVDWAKDLNDFDPDNPADPAFYRAFHKTMAPGLRLTVAPDDVGAMDRRFGGPIVAFRQSDLVGVCLRNRGQCKFTPQGLVDWKQTPKSQQSPATVECTLAVNLECPEGVYGLKVPMRATTDEAGRKDWQIATNPNSLVQSVRLTEYGQRVFGLQRAAVNAGGRFLWFAQEPSRQDRGYLLFVKHAYSPPSEQAYLNVQPKMAQIALIGTVAVVDQSVIGYEADLFDRIFVPILGPEVSKAPEDRKKKEAEMRKTFAYVWNNGRIRIPGAYAKDNPDKNPVIVVGDKHIEIRFPVELGLAGGDSAANTARGRLVLVCDDPAIVADVKAARAKANPADAVEVSPLQLGTPDSVAWRLVRIESDLNPLPASPQGGRDNMPAGMGGPGG